jgi:hypothetical protein
MNSISSCNGRGSSVGVAIGVSVVPTSAWPCQGIANITRPSDVCGTMIAESADKKEWWNTRWIPWLGAIMVSTSGSASRRTESEKRTGRVDDHARRDRPFTPGFLIGRNDAINEAIGAFRHAHHTDVVDPGSHPGRQRFPRD